MNPVAFPADPVPNFICPTCGYFGETTWTSYATEDFGEDRLAFGSYELLGMILIDHLRGYPFFLALQRHFSVLTKFAHVELRVCGRKGRGKTSFDVPVNPCVRSICSRSVAVGLKASRSRSGESSCPDTP
jgi:hypothetical protein